MASNNKPKFYVVWHGRRPGIYTNWADASEQVTGFAGAKFKSYLTRAEAESAFASSAPVYPSAAAAGTSGARGKPAPLSLGRLQAIGVELDAVAVDAACNGSPGDMEYRGVRIGSGEELFSAGPYLDGTNNIGEYLALIDAARLLKERGELHTVIYSDSRIAQGWLRARHCGTKLAHTGRNDIIFDLIERGTRWLRENHISNPIRKWETDQWGEIPADYGRK